MPPVTDPSAAPAYALNTLHAAGYEPYAVDGEPDWYRLPGQQPKPWKMCMEDVGLENARLRSEIITAKNDLMVAKARVVEVEAKNAKLTSVEPKSGFLTTEFLLTAGTVLPMVGGVVFTVVADQAAVLFPPPWGTLLAAIAAGLSAKLVKDYTGKRTEIKEKAADAKKAITEGDQK